MVQILNILTLIFLCIAVAEGFLNFKNNQTSEFSKYSNWVLLLSIVFGFSALFYRFYEHGFFILGKATILKIIGLSILTSYLLIDVFQKIKKGDFVTLILGAIFIIVGFMLNTTQLEIKPLQKSVIFGLHISTSILGYTAFALSFMSSCIYLFMHSQLKKGKLNSLMQKFPPLESLNERILYFILIGWIALNLTVILGFFLNNNNTFELSLKLSDPQIIGTLFTILIYSIALIFRWRNGWGGTKMAYLAIIGFLISILTFLGKDIFWQSAHEFIVG